MKKNYYLFLFLFYSLNLTAQNSPLWNCLSRDFIIEDIEFDGNYVWAATQGGLVKIDTINKTAQQFNPTNSPLISLSVYDLEKDVNGNLWIGLQYDNLVRFDGVNWENFITLDGVDTITGVEKIRTTKDGSVYVKSRTSAGMYSISKFNGITFDEIIPPVVSCCYDFEVDTSGQLYFYSDTLLFHFDGSNWIQSDTAFNFPKGIIYDFKIDINNNFLLIVLDSSKYKLYKFDANGWNYISPTISHIPEVNFHPFQRGYEFNIFASLGAVNGIVKYDGQSFIEYNQTTLGSPHSLIYTVNMDSIGKIWYMPYIGFDTTLYVYNGVTTESFYCSNSKLHCPYVSDIEVAKDGAKWFSFSGNGVQRFDGYTWVAYDTSNSNICYNYIVDIQIDHSGTLWCCADDYGNPHPAVSSFDGVNWVSYPNSNFGGFGRVSKCQVDKFNNMYFAVSNEGVTKFDGTNWTFWDGASFGLTNFRVFDIVVDTNNILWVSTLDSGIFKYDNFSWTKYNKSNSDLSSNVITQIFCDKNTNNIWYRCGPTHEWGIFDGTNFKTFYDTSSSYFCLPYCIAPSDTNFCWTGTGGQNGALSKYFYNDSSVHYNKYNFDLGDGVSSIAIDKKGSLWIAGYVNGVFIYNEQGIDIPFWYNYASKGFGGHTFIDVDSDGVFTPNIDYDFIGQRFICLNDSSQVFANSVGNYQFYKDEGNYQSTYINNAKWILTTDTTIYHTTIDTTSVTGLDYGFKAAYNFDQIDIDITNSSGRCNNPNAIWLYYKNTGTQKSNGEIKLMLDDSVTFIAASPSPDSIFNNSLFWKYYVLVPGQQRLVLVNTINPSVSSLNDTMHTTCTVTDTLGNVWNNNKAQLITCAYDPNSKEGEPYGVSKNHFIAIGDSLEYTIHFQNIGNDTAFNIIVLDTLSTYFDFNSIEFLSSSHVGHLSVSNNGVLKMAFFNIQLPCSTANEPGSNGYFKFRIFPKPGLAHGTKVINRVFIYFDLNLPIITNTTSHIYLYPALSIYEPLKSSSFTITPNPTFNFVQIKFKQEGYEIADLQLYDASGQVIFTRTNLHQNEKFDLGKLTTGFYIARLTYNGIDYYAKLLKLE